MVAEDQVRALALQAVSDLVAARTREVDSIEGNIALLQGHLATLLDCFSTPIFPPGFEPSGANDVRLSPGDGLEGAQNLSVVDKDLSMIALAASTGLATKELAVTVDGSPGKHPVGRLPSLFQGDKSLGVSLDPIVVEEASDLARGTSCQDNAHNKVVELGGRCVSRNDHHGSTHGLVGMDELRAVEQFEVQAGCSDGARLLSNNGDLADIHTSQEAGYCGWTSKLTWEEIATLATKESPETVFDWSILGAQGVCQDSEEDSALESFFQNILKPHSKSARQLSFDDLENYKAMFQWLIVEEAKAVYEGGNWSLAWNDPQQKCTWNLQETLRPASSLFCTFSVDPSQPDQSASKRLSCLKVNDVVLVLSPTLRQSHRVAIVERVEGEHIGLRMRVGCDPSLYQVLQLLQSIFAMRHAEDV